MKIALLERSRGVSVLLLLLFGPALPAAEPLHVRIDRIVESQSLIPPAGPASDGEFLRRASLDLCNCIASVDDARAFLTDANPGKRAALIDRLLATPQHARRLANYLDVSLMERRGDKYVARADWENWLYQACVENRSWDQMIREVIVADGVDPARRGPAKFALEREGDPHLLARDVGRMFFGRDVQCAQCHNHPNVKDYEQREYYGLLSYFQRIEFVKRADGSYVLSEKAEGDATFHSVFKKDVQYAARPAIPGKAADREPPVKSGQEYVAPAVPKQSRRQLFSQSATAGNCRAFNRNIANRLWAMMMGRGLVHPIDFDHADNPPTHPELLDLLADEIVALKYDLRALLRELALSKTYQRSFDPPADLASSIVSIRERLPALETAIAPAQKAVDEANEKLVAVRRESLPARESVDKALAELRAAEAALAAARKVWYPANAALAATKQQTQLKTDAQAALTKAVEPIKEALAKLPADADLKQTFEKLQAKVTQLGAELQALAKTAQTQADAAKQATDKVQAAEQSVAALNDKLNQADEQARPALTQLEAARQAQQKAKAELARHERRLQVAKSLAAFREKTEALSQAEKKAGPAVADLAAAQQAHREAAARARGHLHNLTAAEKDLSAQQAKLAAGKSSLQQKHQAVASLNSSIEQVEKTAASLKDEELTKTVATMRQRALAHANTSTEVAKQMAALEAQMPALHAKCETLRKDRGPLDQAVATAVARVAQIEEQRKAPLAELREAQTQHNATRQDVLERLSVELVVAPLRPLTPEQLHWSVFRATGILSSYEAAADAELNKKQPHTDAQKKDAAFTLQRIRDREKEVYAKLGGNLPTYARLFAGGPGQPQFEFFATADQALFMENSDAIRAWTAPGVSLVHRMSQQTDPAAIADELYLTVINRRPTAAEVAEVKDWFTRRGGPSPTAHSELAWALLASAEFRFNH